MAGLQSHVLVVILLIDVRVYATKSHLIGYTIIRNLNGTILPWDIFAKKFKHAFSQRETILVKVLIQRNLECRICQKMLYYSLLIIAIAASCVKCQIMKFGNCPDVKLQENFEPSTVSTGGIVYGIFIIGVKSLW